MWGGGKKRDVPCRDDEQMLQKKGRVPSKVALHANLFDVLFCLQIKNYMHNVSSKICENLSSFSRV